MRRCGHRLGHRRPVLCCTASQVWLQGGCLLLPAASDGACCDVHASSASTRPQPPDPPAGLQVTVCESHSIPGGAAHAWVRDGYHFESGPSLYSGMAGADRSYWSPVMGGRRFACLWWLACFTSHQPLLSPPHQVGHASRTAACLCSCAHDTPALWRVQCIRVASCTANAACTTGAYPPPHI
jgi:hypothetical protein